jgi:hypothetical protein
VGSITRRQNKKDQDTNNQNICSVISVSDFIGFDGVSLISGGEDVS